MCSIEEAWAGQKFSDKPVSSQGDLRKAYMSLPNDIMTHNNEFSMKSNNIQQPLSLSRGINSKYSREHRVPNIARNSNNATINFSSTMPPYNYEGVEPIPQYMEIYDNSAPSPNMVGENFNDINSAFDVSSDLNEFMQNSTHNQLLDEDTHEEINIVNSKYNNKKNKNNFSNIKQTSKYNSTDKTSSDSDEYINSLNTINSVYSREYQHILFILQQVIIKLDKIESELHIQQSRNTYDIILYILIGMILSFILYSVFYSLKNK